MNTQKIRNIQFKQVVKFLYETSIKDDFPHFFPAYLSSLKKDQIIALLY